MAILCGGCTAVAQQCRYGTARLWRSGGGRPLAKHDEVRESERGGWRSLGAVEDGPEAPAEPRPPRHDVVEARIHVAVDNHVERKLRPEPADRRLRVRAGVGNQAVTPPVRQVVD